MKFLIVLLLAGCSSGVKHETTSLQCLGFCSFTNVNHESAKDEANDKAP